MKTIKVPDLSYTIDGDIIELQQDMGCGEFAVIDVHRIHLKLIAEEMRITEPAPVSMNEVVKLELMELLEAISDLWGDIGDRDYTDITMLTDAKTLHQKCLSICRIAGCNLDVGNDDSVTSALATQSKTDLVRTHDIFNESSVSAHASLLEA